MQCKTFRGPNTRVVLEQVKAELGPKAVILSTSTVEENGKTICEVMAAIEPESVSSEPATMEQAPVERPQPPQWQREWGQIKSYLLTLLENQIDFGKLTPRQRHALDYLDNEGVDRKIILSLYSKLRESPRVSILSLLSEIVYIKPWNESNWPATFHCFAGPYGSGKTSCLIRFALDHKRKHPGDNICLVNGDESQGKGRLMLRRYAELSGLAYVEVNSKQDFQKLVGSSRDYDRVFIDLPGLSHDGNLSDWLEDRGMIEVKDLDVHLVLAPYFNQAQYDAFLSRFVTERTGSLVWTKLDEASTYGAIINVAETSAIPVSALSYGPGLKNTITPAESMMLWKLIFKHELPSGAVLAGVLA
jgi:flagellar biosynthesis protein FlhF